MKKIEITIQEYLYALMTMFMLIGATIFPNYATDTYATFADPAKAAADMLTRNGRPVTALIYKLATILNIKDVTSIWVYTVLGFICLYFAIILYEDSLRQYIRNDLLRCLVATLAICNIYIVEFFMFLEKVSFLLTILCCVIGYRGVQKIIEGRSSSKIVDIILAMIALIIAACTYQPVLSLFAVLLLPVILRKQYTWVFKIKWLFITAFMYGGAGIIDLMILRLNGSARVVGGGYTLYEKIRAFKSLPLNSISAFEIVPKGFWIGTVAIIMILCFILASREEKGKILVNMVLVEVGTEACALSTFMLGVGWFGPRIIYVFASLPMIIVVFGFVNAVFVDEKEHNFSRINKVLLVIIVLNIVVSSMGLNHIFKDRYITNVLDEYRCDTIAEAIMDYEEENGMAVSKIVFYEDQHLDKYEKLLTSNSIFRASAFDASWSEIKAIEYYTGRTFERGEADDSINEQFSKEDWKAYSEKQLIFDGDTLHICKY